MKKNPTDFDEFLVATILADLFEETDTDDPDYLAQKILKGLKENGLIKLGDDENNEVIAA